MQRDTPTYLLLGPFLVLDERGGALDLGGAQRRAVLAQLALAPGRTLSVSAIGEGLWADRPPPTSHKSIQIHVSKLRRHLPDGVLATRAPGYALDVPAAAVDVGCFEDDVARGARELEAGRPERAAEVLRRALDLWRGPVLSDLASHPFVAPVAARLDEARGKALDDRIAADLALGRHAVLVGELEAMVRDDPRRERLWVHLMTALYRSERQADALDAYARARHHLVEELGIEPGTELRTLEQQVLNHAVPPVGPATPTEPARPVLPAGQPRPATLRAPGPVVGRAEPLALLERALHEASQGTGAVVAVRGEEGFGKTTLMAAFADAAGDDCLVLAGRCREHVSVPFGPWTDVLHQLGDHEVIDLLEGTPAAGGDAPERRRAELLHAVVAVLHDAARDRPVLVVLDDLQWSDDASIALLLHAAEQLADAPVLFLTAWRDREVGLGHPVARLVHRSTRAGAATIELAPLDSADVAQLLAHAELGGDASQVRRVASLIHQQTSGVPLFVTDVVSTLRATHGVLPDPDDVAPSIPETARTLVSGRLAGAGQDAALVAEACAVLTDPFEASLVPALLPEVAPATVLASLDALVDAGLLEEGPVGHAFAHTAYRRAIDDGLRAGRRQTLHAAAFRALERTAVPAAVLAHHSESAGVLVPRSDVLHHLQRAGADAAARGAFADAALFFGRAVERSEPGAKARGTALVAHADALWRAGDITAAKAVAAEVIDLAGDPNLPDQVLADAVVIHSWFGAGYGVDASSIAAADAALEVVADGEQRARLRVAAAFQHATWGSPLDVAVDAVTLALVELPEPCPPELAADALLAESQAMLGTPDLARRERLADELLELGRSRGSWRDVGRALRMRSLVEMSAGRRLALDATLDELLEVADRLGSWLYRADAWRWRAAVGLAAGDEAATVHALAELDRAAADPFAGRAFVGTQRVLRLWTRGDLEACLALIDGLRSALPEDPTRAPDRRVVDLFRLVVLADAGRADEARQELLRLAPVADLDRSPSRHRQAELAYTSHLVARFGLVEQAPGLIRRLEPYRGQLLVLSWGEAILGAADRYLGELRSLVDGEVDQQAFREATDLEEEAGAVVEAERSRAAWRRATDRRAGQRS